MLTISNNGVCRNINTDIVFTRSDYIHFGNTFASSLGYNFELGFILDSETVRLYTSTKGSYTFSVRCCTEIMSHTCLNYNFEKILIFHCVNMICHTIRYADCEWTQRHRLVCEENIDWVHTLDNRCVITYIDSVRFFLEFHWYRVLSASRIENYHLGNTFSGILTNRNTMFRFEVFPKVSYYLTIYLSYGFQNKLVGSWTHLRAVYQAQRHLLCLDRQPTRPR